VDIRTEQEYNAALACAEQLMDAELSPEGEAELSALADKIKAYEETHYPMCGEKERLSRAIGYMFDGPLTAAVRLYFKLRGYKMPTIEEALMFAHTELGEVYEILLAQQGGWKRNHPEDKPGYSVEALGEELGDAIMMLIIAGVVVGTNPVEALRAKMMRKLREKKDAAETA